MTVTGRITYALARDGAFPYSPFLAKTFPKMRRWACTQAPLSCSVMIKMLRP